EQTFLQQKDREEARPRHLSLYIVRFLHRWDLGTAYPVIVRDVAAMVRRSPLDWPPLIIDRTGVGAAVTDMFRDHHDMRAVLKPVLITGGHETVLAPDGCWHVPKKELAAVVLALGQSGRLKVVPMEHRDILDKELLTFRVKVSVAGNESFEAWRERDH